MYRIVSCALGFLLGILVIDTALAEHVRATWYGHELGGRRTASGQIFNPHDPYSSCRSWAKLSVTGWTSIVLARDEATSTTGESFTCGTRDG